MDLLVSWSQCFIAVAKQTIRPFSKMAAENLNEAKLAKITNVYQH